MYMNYKKTKLSCYSTYLSMSSVFSLPPLLFNTFRDMYGISYTLLGTLVLINFCTQLLIDLIFSFFAKHFNIKKTVRIMPLITSLGLAVYAIVPSVLPNHAYIGLVTGTVIFSVSAGLSEVLISPTVAAIPSETPEKDMSALHSLYAYGVLFVILVSTGFIKIFGSENWMYLTLFYAALPLLSHIMFCTSPMPDIKTSSPVKDNKNKQGAKLALFALCIFLGSAAENAMTNWISSYAENALKISKIWGDILGMAMFAVLLGAGRTLYAKFGKHISRVLLISMSGAAACYLVAGFSSNAVVSLIACALTGLCTSMLWPGTLIMMEEHIPNVGVVAYALMAAGGDFGGSVAPQLLGYIVDKVSVSSFAAEFCTKLSITAEQFGLKVGIIAASAFPIIGIAVIIVIRRLYSKRASGLSAFATP